MKKLSILTVMIFMSISLAFAGYYSSYAISSYHYKQFSTSGNANISLYDANNKQKGLLIFLAVDPSELPAASQDANGLVRLYYPSTRLHDVIDLLRNESPVALHYWHGSGQNSHIGTAKRELVGEGE